MSKQLRRLRIFALGRASWPKRHIAVHAREQICHPTKGWRWNGEGNFFRVPEDWKHLQLARKRGFVWGGMPKFPQAFVR